MRRLKECHTQFDRKSSLVVVTSCNTVAMKRFSTVFVIFCVTWSELNAQVYMIDRRVDRIRDLTNRVNKLNLKFRDLSLNKMVQIRTGKLFPPNVSI